MRISIVPRQRACLLAIMACLTSAAPAQEAPPYAPPVADPVLANFVTSLVERNPVVARASAAQDTARALGDAAAQPLFNPELELDYEDAVDETWSAGISQTIDWGGKRQARTNVADAQSLAATAGLDAIRNQVTGEILSELAAYWTTTELLRLAKLRADLLADFATQAATRRIAGDLTASDANLASVAYANARLQGAQVAATLAGQVRRLVALGAPQDTAAWPAMPDQLPPLNVLPAAANNLVATLPAVQSARHATAGAEARAELAERERRPDPAVQVRAGQEDGESLIGVGFSIPLPVRNSFKAEVAAARSEAAEARATEREARLLATQRLLSAMESYTTLFSAWETWALSGEALLRQQAGVLQTLADSGELSIAEFLVRARELLELNITVMEIRGELWGAWIEWLTAAGIADAWLREPVKENPAEQTAHQTGTRP